MVLGAGVCVVDCVVDCGAILVVLGMEQSADEPSGGKKVEAEEEVVQCSRT